MGYITSDALKASLDLTGVTYADDDITLAISAASEQVNEQCNRRFTLDETNDNVRLYRPIGRLVDIDDASDIQGVAIGYGDGTFPTVLTLNVDYELEPLNSAADNEPYTMIRLKRHHHHRCHQVQITGQFGWPAVPDLVMSATSLLASRIMRRMREAPFGVVQMGLDGQAARIAQTDPDVCAMLMPLTRFLVR